LMRVSATVGFDHRFHSENSGGRAVLQ
jgi:hypothetical protein